MKDITYCCANECPSKECQIKVTNNHFEAGDIISMADFAGVCRFYISLVVSKMDEVEE